MNTTESLQALQAELKQQVNGAEIQVGVAHRLSVKSVYGCGLIEQEAIAKYQTLKSELNAVETLLKDYE
jgi:hypothetical protein